MRSKVLAVLAVCVAAVAISAQDIPMKPGQWESTVKMEMPGLPVQMPEMKSSECLTAEDMKRALTTGVANPLGGGTGGDDACKVSDYKISGNTVTWTLACSAPQAMTGAGQLTFVGDTYSGAMKMATPQGEMVMNMAGKRVGECK